MSVAKDTEGALDGPAAAAARLAALARRRRGSGRWRLNRRGHAKDPFLGPALPTGVDPNAACTLACRCRGPCSSPLTTKLPPDRTHLTVHGKLNEELYPAAWARVCNTPHSLLVTNPSRL